MKVNRQAQTTTFSKRNQMHKYKIRSYWLGKNTTAEELFYPETAYGSATCHSCQKKRQISFWGKLNGF